MVTRRDDEKKKGKVEKENFVIFLSIYFIFFLFSKNFCSAKLRLQVPIMPAHVLPFPQFSREARR